MTTEDLPQIANPHVRMVLETVDQADVIYVAIQDNYEYLSKWIHWVTADYTRERNRKAIEGNVTDWQNGNSYVVCVYYDGEFAGCVDTRINDDGVWEVGYWLVEKFAGRGLATECTTVLIDYVQQLRDIDTFELFAAADNAASNRVAEKLGFHKVGETTTENGENHYVKQYR